MPGRWCHCLDTGCKLPHCSHHSLVEPPEFHQFHQMLRQEKTSHQMLELHPMESLMSSISVLLYSIDLLMSLKLGPLNSSISRSIVFVASLCPVAKSSGMPAREGEPPTNHALPHELSVWHSVCGFCQASAASPVIIVSAAGLRGPHLLA